MLKNKKPERMPLYNLVEARQKQAIITIFRKDGTTQEIKTGPAFFILDKGETLESKAKLVAQDIAGSWLKSYNVTVV